LKYVSLTSYIYMCSVYSFSVFFVYIFLSPFWLIQCNRDVPVHANKSILYSHWFFWGTELSQDCISFFFWR
jgi:hypothetical protein